MEGIAVLAVIGSGSWTNRDTPEDTLDVCQRRGIRAGIRVRVERRVALEVEVECYAAGGLGAEGGALVGVVFVEVGVAHVGGGGG